MSSTDFDESFGRDDDKPATQAFRASLGGLRAKVRRGISLEGMSLLSWSFLVYFFVTLFVDKLFRLEQPVRALLLAAALAWFITRLYRVMIAPLRMSLDDEELALAVERSKPGLGQRLISSIQFHEALKSGRTKGVSTGLMRQVLSEFAAILPTLDFGSAIKRQRMRKNVSVFSFCGAFILGFAGLYSDFGIWASRNLLISGSVEWPRYAQLTVVGAKNGEIVVPRGDDFTVEVDVTVDASVENPQDYLPDSLKLSYWFDDGTGASESMIQNTGEQRFSFTFPGLMQPVSFYASGGDGLSKTIRIRLVDRPILAQFELELRYPGYMRKEAMSVPADATELTVPRGSRIEVKAKASKALVHAGLAIGQKQKVDATLGEDKLTITGSIEPEISGLFVVTMKDTDGLVQGNTQALLLKVVGDRAPRMTVRVRGIGAKITPQAILPFDLVANDDWGLMRLALFWAKGANAGIGSGTELGKGFAEGETQGLDAFKENMIFFERRVRFDLLPFLKNAKDLADPVNPVRPGQFVSVRFKAWDSYVKEGAKEGQSAVSDSYTFKVVEPTELLGELIRRQSEQRREFEKIIGDHERDMTEFGDLDSPKVPGNRGQKIRRKIASLARHQRYLGKAVKTVEQRFTDILDEMRNNRLGDRVMLSRLRTQIIDPMEDLSADSMPRLARTVSDYGRSGDTVVRRVCVREYDSIARAMKRILKEMKKLESFTEILRRLKGVIRLVHSATALTTTELEKELEEVFRAPDKKKKDRDDEDPEKKEPENQSLEN